MNPDYLVGSSLIVQVGARVLFACALTVVAWLAGRFLGVRRGFWRSVVAALCGYGAGEILARATADSAPDSWSSYAYVPVVLLTMMLASILLDVILTPRGAAGGHAPHPIRAVRRQLEVASRVLQVARIARRNGLVGPRSAQGMLTTALGAQRLRRTLEESGGMLVKFGQIASTRDDLLPEAVTIELAGLRSNMPALAPALVREQIQRNLGAPVGELFQDFHDEPLAAASMAVTHRATLHDGRKVIVKVRRPDIEQTLAKDSRVLVWAARTLQSRSARFRRLQVGALVAELISGVREELDFTRELANNAAMRIARGGDRGIYIPEVIAALTTTEILVMDEVPGVPASAAAAARASAISGVSGKQMADDFFHSFLLQVLRDGQFHADPHPGNVLICDDGRVALIDYGAVGRIDPVTLEALQMMAAGFQLRDASLLARAVRRMGGPEAEQADISILEFDMGMVLSNVSGAGFDPAVLRDVVRVLGRHGIPAPRALTVLGRASLTLEGTLRQFDPGFRMARGAAEQLSDLLGNLDMGPRQLLEREMMRSLPSLRNLPQLAEDLALQTRAGNLRVGVDRFDGTDGKHVQSWLDEALFAGIGAVGSLVAVGLVATSVLAEDPQKSYLAMIGAAALVVSLGMQMRSAARILHRQGGGTVGSG